MLRRVVAASRFRWILAAGTLATLGCATAPGPPVETGELFLWEVARADGRGGVAHLMGSVHLSDESLTFDPAALRALAGAEILVLEVDPDELDPTRMARLMAETGFFADGRTLGSVLSSPTFELLLARLEREGLPKDSFLPMEPWFAAMTLQLIELERQGFAPQQGVEMALAERAESAGKAITGLETADAQIAVLDSLPMRTQELMLRDALDPEGDRERGLALLLDAWRKGDAERIESEIFADLGSDPDLDRYFEALFFERNRRMARGVAEIVDRGAPAFVVLGAGHVVGERGVPALLIEAGYAVRRLAKTPR